MLAIRICWKIDCIFTGSRVDSLKVSSEWTKFNYHRFPTTPTNAINIAVAAPTIAPSTTGPGPNVIGVPPSYEEHFLNLGVLGNAVWPANSLEVRVILACGISRVNIFMLDW